MSVRSRSILIVIALLAVVGAGFGVRISGAVAQDDYEAGKRGYVAAADAVCQSAGRETATADGEPPTTTRDAVAELRRSATAMTRAVAALEGLRPPERDDGLIRDRFVRPARLLSARLTGLAGQAEKELAEGREEAAEAVVERSLAPDDAEVELRSFAVSYGLGACAGG
ncbi:hypothetical protein ABZ897_58805 [Nonomuraea sp. NPDC046802]|uniref:hypothetical protein n=1 Tax=Nonomuraea sp. NPDC046802 TaxID=3154919 RepID=UPI00340FEBFF